MMNQKKLKKSLLKIYTKKKTLNILNKLKKKKNKIMILGKYGRGKTTLFNKLKEFVKDKEIFQKNVTNFDIKKVKKELKRENIIIKIDILKHAKKEK